LNYGNNQRSRKTQTSAEGVEQDVNVILETEFVDTGAGRRRGGFNGHTPKSD
jgi:hypothetical protein